eukprot:CAMPEP_0179218510 /NCGR_PEP_ID=MMETSP0797-20121207/4507_1 /TAXON_ID=47934 /ORGANISM="Dinophysis acuminata, Strain DAEP01" /LENGTH=35 /DNA_ID= /DNA_START= /DNA_END= /DNA_ORIENTATION=
MPLLNYMYRGSPRHGHENCDGLTIHHHWNEICDGH